MEEWTNLIGLYGFIHYVQVDDSTNITQIAAERGWKCGIWNYLCIWIYSPIVRVQQVQNNSMIFILVGFISIYIG
jgi:hypothetical protein